MQCCVEDIIALKSGSCSLPMLNFNDVLANEVEASKLMIYG